MLSFIRKVRFGWVLLFMIACVKTEIIPELLEPKLSITKPANSVITLGNSLILAATYTDDQGQNRSNEIQWAARNAAIASVKNGSVTALSTGQTWIVATVANLRDSVLVSVVEDQTKAAKVEIVTMISGSLKPTETRMLQARVLNGLGQTVGNVPISWQSSNTSVATVDQAGNVVAISTGSAQIVAKAGALQSVPLVIEVANDIQTRTGNFSGSGGYSVSGTASLKKNGTALELSFGNNFMASNGPMLGVFLAKNASGSLSSGNSIKVADLKSNSGGQSYPLPSGIAINDYNYVVIYCIPFNVRFGTALLN
jgi:Electron transfer DM13/Bacterial Ig-like domain (group 2)